jgi:hypothetical protein
MKTSDFYEDAGDLLAGFRQKNGGGKIEKKGNDPFSKDPDVVQSVHDANLNYYEENGVMPDDKSNT